MKPNDGGPAFSGTGITERDYFAAKAMTVIVNKFSTDSPSFCMDVAEFSYRIADAMLEVKNR